MGASRQQGTKRDSIHIRIKPELRGWIDRAAEDALLDRTVFVVSSRAYAEFIARLDAAPQSNERLRRSLETAASWE